MTFIQIYSQGLIIILTLMTLLWLVSVAIKNASIVDPFWGLGFVIISVVYFIKGGGFETRKIILLTLVAIWGLRLSAWLAWRNFGKGEDFRYKQFRKNYGKKRYWWISFFQVFMLQGILMWLVSAPLLGTQYYGASETLNILDFAGILLYIIGFVFEAVGDIQLARFKADPSNKGRVLDKGLWRYTRHPNYFGDSAIWWGYGLICLAAGSYLPVLGSLLMTLLIIRVSGVAMIEKTLRREKPGYEEYIRKTSAFIPWFPRK